MYLTARVAQKIRCTVYCTPAPRHRHVRRRPRVRRWYDKADRPVLKEPHVRRGRADAADPEVDSRALHDLRAEAPQQL